MIITTPYLCKDTLCYLNSSIVKLTNLDIGDQIRLVEYVKVKNIYHYRECIGVITKIHKSVYSNSYIYAINEEDYQIAGLNLSFINRGTPVHVSQHKSSIIVADIINKFKIGYTDIVVVKNIGVMVPERFISISISFDPSEANIKTLLPTGEGFLICLIQD